MDLLLTRYNQEKRNGRKIISSDYIIRKRGKLLHVCLNSSGCRFRDTGSCTMCDYGEGTRLTEEKLEMFWPKIKDAAEGMTSILIGSLGSVLDPEEISMGCLEKICRFLNEMSIQTIIFETHYTMINDKVCRWLRQRLPEKDIVIEVGLESSDPLVQEKCLNKKIDLTVLETKIQMLHRYGMSITANVFLGAPFLSVADQIEDTVKTIQWAIEYGIDSVVVFPANIRENTLLDTLHRSKKYSRIQQWAIFEVLWRTPWHYLNRIYLAWYGDWIDLGDGGKRENLPPFCCNKCSEKWMGFYHHFLEEQENQGRRKILAVYAKMLAADCMCRQEFEKSLQASTKKEREHRIEQGRKWLADEFVLEVDK